MTGRVQRIDESLQAKAALAGEMSAMGVRTARRAQDLHGSLSDFGLERRPQPGAGVMAPRRVA